MRWRLLCVRLLSGFEPRPSAELELGCLFELVAGNRSDLVGRPSLTAPGYTGSTLREGTPGISEARDLNGSHLLCQVQ